MNEILARKLDTRETASSYKRVSRFYDLWGSLTESRALKMVIRLAEIKDHQSILDLGCGTGTLLKEIILRNPNGKNTGIDLSADMLRIADKKFKKARLENYELIQGDALDMNIEDNSIDILVCTFLIDLLPIEKFEEMAKQFYQALKPGAVVIIAHFSFGSKSIHKFWYRIAKRFPGLLTGCRPIIFSNYLAAAGFRIEEDIQVSQNTFPSEIIKARKNS